MMNKMWKYISLYLAGDRYDYIYDMANDKVYTQLFPGIEVESFHLPCGLRVPSDKLKQTIIEKLGLAELRKVIILGGDYEKCF